MAANKERTFIAIKPDGVQRGLIGKIVQRFEERGFKVSFIEETFKDMDIDVNHFLALNSW